MSTAASAYAKPDVLVTTEWLAEHLNDPSIRIIESNEDTLLYASGHIPGAVHVDWTARPQRSDPPRLHRRATASRR